MQKILINDMYLKPVDIPALKLIQLKYEMDTWKRLIGFMVEENVHLKNRISEILKNNFSINLLEGLETYQGRFIKEDILISLMRNELAELDKLLVNGVFNGRIIEEIDQKLNILRNNIENVERNFTKLKLEYNNYLSRNIY